MFQFNSCCHCVSGEVTCVSMVQMQQDCFEDGVGVGVDQDDVILQDG